MQVFDSRKKTEICELAGKKTGKCKFNIERLRKWQLLMWSICPYPGGSLDVYGCIPDPVLGRIAVSVSGLYMYKR